MTALIHPGPGAGVAIVLASRITCSSPWKLCFPRVLCFRAARGWLQASGGQFS